MNYEIKQRHGCVTAWLILMIIGNSITALAYLIAGDVLAIAFNSEDSHLMIIILAFLALFNVIFSTMLLKWKKVGFWGFTASALVAMVININLGLGIAQSVFGLIGIAILYAVLQIRRNSISAWSNLE